MRRPLVISLLAVVAIAVVALGATFATGKSPELGLDLQGGASVVLKPKTQASSGVIDQSIDIIRSRVDALGVSEPDISRQGDSIVVQLPGVKNRDRALSVVGTTAQLFIRPVKGSAPPETPITPPEQDDPRQPVVLPERERDGTVTERLQLGPALVGDEVVSGRIVSKAQANVNPNTGAWQVDVTYTDKGGSLFDRFAQQVGQGNRFAFDLDGEVKSAPSLETTSFDGRATISGSFTQQEAKDLALVLRYGSLPVQLERQSVQTVSATLGRDSLRAGVIAGLIGLGLVALYMVLYYRALGFVVWAGLLVSGALLFSIISAVGVVLSLSGVVGIIVSVGVTVDSYVVYFERLKDEIRSGKTVRSSVDRGFARAYRTIVAADLVSMIAASLLYFLSVGPVRGFAFFLGLATALDLVIAYCFTRPMVVWLGRSRFFTEARWVGVARGLAVEPAGAS